jgi:hypothetical protein
MRAQLLSLFAATLIATPVAAQDSVPAPAELAASTAPTGNRKQYPVVGGHLGFAVPIAIVSKDTTVMGDDFFSLGLTPGLTVHLDLGH